MRKRGIEHLSYFQVDNPMVVPVGKKVRVLITANDVIHSWWVPALGWKQDAIPGFVRDTWFKAEKIGTYRGQCAELCGKDHGFMPIVVKAVSKEDYAKFIAVYGATGTLTIACRNMLQTLRYQTCSSWNTGCFDSQITGPPRLSVSIMRLSLYVE